MFLKEEIQKKWAAVLDHEALGKIKDPLRRGVTAMMLENTESALREASAHNGYQTLSETSSLTPVNAMGSSSSTAGSGNIDTFDPVLISLVRRAMPNLIAYDICGVQPMTGPTGLIFAMRSQYSNATVANAGGEAFYNESNTAFSTLTAGNTTFGQASGTGPSASIPGQTNTSAMVNTAFYNTNFGMSTANAEALGVDSG